MSANAQGSPKCVKSSRHCSVSLDKRSVFSLTLRSLHSERFPFLFPNPLQLLSNVVRTVAEGEGNIYFEFCHWLLTRNKIDHIGAFCGSISVNELLTGEG